MHSPAQKLGRCSRVIISTVIYCTVVFLAQLKVVNVSKTRLETRLVSVVQATQQFAAGSPSDYEDCHMLPVRSGSTVSVTLIRPKSTLSALGVRWRRAIRHAPTKVFSLINMTFALSVLTILLWATQLLTHSLSVAGAKPFVWVGNVTETSFEISIDSATLSSVTNTGYRPLLIISQSSTLNPVTGSLEAAPAFPAPHGTIRRYFASSLSPGTTYYFGVSQGESLGTVTTFPSNPQAEVVFAMSSCQKWAKRSRSLGSIADTLPKPSNNRAVLMVHAGDLHYQNIVNNDAELYRKAMADVVTTEDASRVFSRMQVSYVPDDHDSGPNNSDRDSPSKEAMQINYRRMVPRFANNTSDSSLYHAFTVASVRFIFTDLRTESKKSEGRMMSDKQLDWFLNTELRMASIYSAVVWVSSRPWISEEVCLRMWRFQAFCC